MISKSKYLLGLQCPRLFWVSVNDKHRLPPFDEGTLHRFSEGHIIGGLAKKCFPDGIDIPENFSANLTMTKILLKRKETLFEAGIMVDGLYSRADVLRPVGDKWDIIEVKSSTSVKDVNIHDVSFQKFVYEKAGLRINKCFLMFVNNKYVRDGEIDVDELFSIEEIETVDVNVDWMKKLLKGPEPAFEIGPHCKDPYTCVLMDECFPDSDIFDLYRGGKKCFELLEYGCVKDIPDDYKLTSNQLIQRKNEVHIDKEKIKEFLDTLQYPLYYLDFETIGTGVPLFDGVRPYQQVPFQFSLHVQSIPGGDLVHHSFLAKGGDPRKEFMSTLKSFLGDSGSIVVYNESFEKARLKECRKFMPEYQEFVDSILPRFIDLIVPFWKFWYYNPLQHGSASIKKVLPAITGKGYSDLDINDGQTASLEYLRLYHSDSKFDGNEEKVENVEKIEKVRNDLEKVDKVRNDLEKYCGLDTEGMVWILDELKGLVD